MSSFRESQVAENKIANLPDKPRSVKLFTTLLDENIREIKFSNLAQINQIHEIKYLKILIFEFQLYKLSLKNS